MAVAVGVAVTVRVGEGVIGVAVIATSGVAVGFGVGDARVAVAPAVADATCRAETGAGDAVADRAGVTTSVAEATTVAPSGGVPATRVPATVGGAIVVGVIATVATLGTAVGTASTVAVGGKVTPRGGAISTCVEPTAVRTDPPGATPDPVASATIVSVELRIASFGTSRMVQLWLLPAGTEQLPYVPEDCAPINVSDEPSQLATSMSPGKVARHRTTVRVVSGNRIPRTSVTNARSTRLSRGPSVETSGGGRRETWAGGPATTVAVGAVVTTAMAVGLGVGSPDSGVGEGVPGPTVTVGDRSGVAGATTTGLVVATATTGALAHVIAVPVGPGVTVATYAVAGIAVVDAPAVAPGVAAPAPAVVTARAVVAGVTAPVRDAACAPQ